jgi:alkylation response protein AidB-like acyl-CoA dehydrogenase
MRKERLDLDFTFSEKENRLRTEVADFVDQEWEDKGKDVTSLWVASHDVDDVPERERIHEFTRKLVEKDWWTMHWPKEYGGHQAPISTIVAYREAMAYAGAPESMGGGIEAPTLMLHGTKWQKDFFLPKIASGEISRWSQGFSEPNAGSDLASIETRAVEDGDDYIINGQKIWNSDGAWSDWGHYLVRTDPTAPKHRGISYILIDMNTPGVTMLPLYDGLGRRRWSQIFLEDVRVPKQNLLGEENRGFYVAMTTLSFERIPIEVPARLQRYLERFIQAVKNKEIPAVEGNSGAKNIMADLRVQIEVARMMMYRGAWLQSQGAVPESEASMTKLMCDETGIKVYKTLARLAGENSLYMPRSSDKAALNGLLGVNSWLSTAFSLGGGSLEVQRQIIAQRGLTLPR